MSKQLPRQESDESSETTIDLKQLDIERHLGCSRIDISPRTTAHSYDDEPDSIVLRDSSGGKATLSAQDAQEIRDDLDDALEALAEEAARRYDER
jgi:hypothetical protein